MSDAVMLLTGLAVFSLMLIGVVLTAVEFGQVQRNSDSTPHEQADLSATAVRSKSEDPD